MKTVRIGIIGGGLMGREMASAFARWFALLDMPVKPVLVAVADLNPDAREWFRQIDSVKLLTENYKDLLASTEVDVVYVAVPHHLHEEIYIDVLRSGKDLFAEKPFGRDLAAANRIQSVVMETNRFVRCSSEFPFFPAAQKAFEYARSGACGRILDAVSGFHHSSDLDSTKVANWKRQSITCGEIGVLGDLGMHVFHLPLRLGWKPGRLYALLSKGYPERPDGKGGVAVCDTWDNACIMSWIEPKGVANPFPLRSEMKRLAPGEMNTWFFEVNGTEGGVRFSSKKPKTLEVFVRDGNQYWQQNDVGFDTQFKTITGGIFEVGFPDVIQQMWAAYLMEREGLLGDRFACVSVEEAVASQEIFAAALRSQNSQTVESV